MARGGPNSFFGAIVDDRYRLDTLLGAGGSGAVYRGHDLPLGRTVAVKLLAKEHFAGGMVGFRAEALAASRVNHPNAVAIYAVGTWNDLPYLVMEEAPGVSLAQLLDDGPFPVDRAVRIAAQVLAALAEAHRCGVVHCDVSSDNVIVNDDDGDHVTVIDFGLARLGGDPDRQRLVGTAEYLAPEQIRSGTITPAVDIYAVGILLYEMLIGRTPFAGGEDSVILDGHLHAIPTAVHECIAHCPPDLSTLIYQALAKEPDLRPSSADAMRSRLVACAIVEHEVARPTSDRGRVELIGRQREQAVVEAFLGQKVGALVLLGPEGAGKKRLVHEAARALGADVQVIVAAPGPLGHGPWKPILEVLSAILGIQAPTMAELTRAVAQLGLPDRDVPGLADLFGVGEARDLDRTALRTEAMTSARRVIDAAARRLPRTAIAFVDVDRFDPASRALAIELATSARDRGLAIAISCETAPEVDAAETLSLEPLSAQHTRALLAALVPEDATVEAATHMATGWPARIEQIAAWIGEGRPIQTIPTSLVDLISQRILRTSPERRRLIQGLATLGGRATRRELEELVPDVDLAAIPALLELDDDGAHLHSDLVLQIALACIPADARRQLHRRAADIASDADPAARAWHAERGEIFEQAYSMHTKAGHEAFARFDNPGAAAEYARAADCARALIERGSANAERNFIAAAVLAAEALLDEQQADAAVELLGRAAELGPRGSQLAALQRAHGIAAAQRGQISEGQRFWEQAISTGLAAADLELVSDAYLLLAESLVRDGDLVGAERELQQAVDVATGGVGWSNARAPLRLWRVGYRLAQLKLDAGELDAARAVAVDSLALARRRHSANGQARLAALIASICEASGDFASALRYRANAIKGLRQLGDRRSTAELLIASAASQRDRRAADFAEILAAEVDWTEGVQRSRALGSEGDGD